LRQPDERGTGVVGTAFGAAVFIAFLLLATHTLLSLYASSVISSTAWDAARSIATTEDVGTKAAARSKAEGRLDGFKNVDLDVTENADGVVVRVRADRPMFLPAALARSSGLSRLDKTVHARTETWR
jgi:Flp pilus assembly protein TadG